MYIAEIAPAATAAGTLHPMKLFAGIKGAGASAGMAVGPLLPWQVTGVSTAPERSVSEGWTFLLK